MTGMWKKYEVELYFTTRFADSVPKGLETDTKPWNSGGKPCEPANCFHATFMRDQKGLYYQARSIKAHMKDCARQLEATLGISDLRKRIADHLEVYPERIYFNKVEPDGSVVRIIQTI